jgi:hypothetical protein
VSNRVVTIVRWCLVAPVAVAAWATIAVVAMWTLDWLEPALCPSGDWNSGFCNNAWVMRAMDVVEHAFIGLSAVVVIVSAVVAAPAHKRSVAWLAFAVGAFAAMALLAMLDFGVVSHAIAALACGAATTWAIRRIDGRPRLPASLPVGP